MITPARWLLPQVPESEAESLAGELRVGRPAARVLIRRGYGDPEAARRYLYPSLDDLHDPFLLQDMRKAASRLRTAILNKEKILLYGDYDVDGVTSIVVLKKAIELAGGSASFHVPNRLRDGYGMRPEVIGQAAGDGVTLLISADTGIRAVEAVRRAQGLGIDVIVTDHHLPEAELPPAFAVLNPNRADCTYPEKNLCGVGVVFKLVQALLRTLEWPAERMQRLTGSLLKLVAIGTVGDVVPLTGENRILVRHGLEGLRSVRNPGLRALLNVAGFSEGETPSAGQVAFRIAPRMNAAGRMADANNVIDLFTTGDQQRARELAAQLHALNLERQQAEFEIVRSILEECAQVPVTDRQATLVFSGEGWHRGVVGIVASRLVEKYNRPVIVLGVDSSQGLAQGSGRSTRSLNLLEALESMSDLFVRFGGHRQAVGLTLEASRVGELRERLNAYAGARIGAEDLVQELEIDALLDLGEISDETVSEILSMAPFGCGNPAPIFAVRGVEVAGEPSVLKERHLRVRLRQHGRNLMCKAWNFAGRAREFERGARVDVALSFEEDYHSRNRGFPGWSAVLRDVRPA